MKTGDKLARHDAVRASRHTSHGEALERLLHGPLHRRGPKQPRVEGNRTCVSCPRTISANKKECYNCQRAREEREARGL